MANLSCVISKSASSLWLQTLGIFTSTKYKETLSSTNNQYYWMLASTFWKGSELVVTRWVQIKAE